MFFLSFYINTTQHLNPVLFFHPGRSCFLHALSIIFKPLNSLIPTNSWAAQRPSKARVLICHWQGEGGIFPSVLDSWHKVNNKAIFRRLGDDCKHPSKTPFSSSANVIISDHKCLSYFSCSPSQALLSFCSCCFYSYLPIIWMQTTDRAGKQLIRSRKPISQGWSEAPAAPAVLRTRLSLTLTLWIPTCAACSVPLLCMISFSWECSNKDDLGGLLGRRNRCFVQFTPRVWRWCCVGTNSWVNSWLNSCFNPSLTPGSVARPEEFCCWGSTICKRRLKPEQLPKNTFISRVSLVKNRIHPKERNILAQSAGSSGIWDSPAPSQCWQNIPFSLQCTSQDCWPL